MLPFLPAIGVRFDIQKVNSGTYGLECWKIFWRAISPTELRGAFLYEGDTASTLAGKEDVYCLGVLSINAEVIARVKRALAASADYQRVAANPMFVEGEACTREPLVNAGEVQHDGTIGGKPGWAKPGLEAVAGTMPRAANSASNAGAASPTHGHHRNVERARPKLEVQSGAWVGSFLAVGVFLSGLVVLVWIFALPFLS